jgi:hypothetical protein
VSTKPKSTPRILHARSPLRRWLEWLAFLVVRRRTRGSLVFAPWRCHDFLRDLRPLCGADFVYQWSDRLYGNSAVMHFRRGSANGAALLERGTRVRTFWPRQLLDFGSLAGVVRDLHVLPAFAFDPLWIDRDRRQRVNDYCNTFEDFFTAPGAVGLDDFFPGAYAYHWHNQWTTPIRPGTLAGRFRDEIDARLRAAGPG